jgi:hypothetical protein
MEAAKIMAALGAVVQAGLQAIVALPFGDHPIIRCFPPGPDAM